MRPEVPTGANYTALCGPKARPIAASAVVGYDQHFSHLAITPSYLARTARRESVSRY